MFTIFMVAILTFSFGLVIYRLPLLRSRHELDSWVSREAAFLANNWILLFSAFFVLFATMFPTLSEAVHGRAPDRRPAVLQQVDAADRPDPAAADRHRAAARVAQVDASRIWSSSSCGRRWPRVVTGGGARTRSAFASGARGACFALCAFVTVTIGAGVHPRRAGAQGRDRHRHRHRDDRPGRPLAAALRRLHRPRRHRADVPRLRRARGSSRKSRCC